MVKRLPRWARAAFGGRGPVWLGFICLLHLSFLGYSFFPLAARNWRSLMWIAAPLGALLIYTLYFSSLSFLVRVLLPLYARHGRNGFSQDAPEWGRPLLGKSVEERVRAVRPISPVFVVRRAPLRRMMM